MNITKSQKRIAFAISMLMLVSLACLSGGNTANTAENMESTPDLEATTVSIQQTQTALESTIVEDSDPADPGSVPDNVYFTEFDDLNEWEFYWASEDSSVYIVESYEPGLYIYTPADDWIAGYADVWMTDVRLEVDFEFIDGPDDTYIDVYCRSTVDSEYVFSVFSDGFWEIGFYDFANGNNTETTYEALTSGQTSLNDQGNFLIAYCEGSELTLYINGEFAGETIADYIYEGQVGLGVLANPTGSGEWFFNYFAAEDLGN